MISATSRMTLPAIVLLIAVGWASGQGLGQSQPGTPQPPRPVSQPLPQGRLEAQPTAPPSVPLRLEVLPPPRAEVPAPRSDGKLGPPPGTTASPSPGKPIGIPGGRLPLGLSTVLQAVDQHYPLVRAAEQERIIASGRAMTSQGAFDTNFRTGYINGGETYDNNRYLFQFDQPTPYQGVSLMAAYRLGAGNYPVYYGDRKTAEGGEFRAGMMVPLLRNRVIDQARANIVKADIDRQAAEPSIDLQRIDITRAATRAYWVWVATGQRLMVAQEILRIARLRDVQLGKRVQAGNLARIEQDDNRRVIADREARLISVQRQFEQASIALSLYYRDDAGKPVILGMPDLPALTEPCGVPDKEKRSTDLEQALTRRPELAQLALQRRKVVVDLDLAENQTLPNLNVALLGASDVGFGKRSPSSTSALDRYTYEAAVLFDVPLQRRQARGRILAARGEIARLNERERFLRDRITTEVQDALNALDRSYELTIKGKAVRRLNEYLAEAERLRFDAGKSDLFRINIRELNAAESRFLEIDAAAEFYRSLANYLAALGLDPARTHH